jgi:hypothetical protein
MNRIIYAISVIGVACLCVDASADEAKTNDEKKSRRDECVFFSTTYDWRALNELNMVLWAPNKHQAYHVGLTQPVAGLRFANALAFIDGNGDRLFCSYGGDAIATDKVGVLEKSSIHFIKQLDADDIANLEKQYKVDLSRKQPDQKKKIPKEPSRETAE